MTRDEAINLIHSAWRPGEKSGHRRILYLLGLLGNPHKSLRFVHIAGTNGKGSTAAMLDSILREAGYRTGRFVSPYLERFEERITVDGVQIEERELVACLEQVQEASAQMQKDGLTPPTEFETVFAIALLHYVRQGCEIVVLEAGLGGARDITNVIDTPEAAVLTSVSIDHTRQLGETLGDIARDKAGIIKPGGRVVIYPVQEPEVATILMGRALEQGAQAVVPVMTELEVTYCSLDGNAFTYRGEAYELPLPGMHQATNAVTVLETVEVLRGRGFVLPYEAVARGLDNTRFAGRFELVGEAPLRMVDGGHNADGMQTLQRAVELLLRPEIERLIVIFGMMEDKKWEPCLATAADMADILILTKTPDPRSLDPALAASLSTCADTRVEPQGKKALALARSLASPRDGILVCGSIYLAGELRAELAGE